MQAGGGAAHSLGERAAFGEIAVRSQDGAGPGHHQPHLHRHGRKAGADHEGHGQRSPSGDRVSPVARPSTRSGVTGAIRRAICSTLASGLKESNSTFDATGLSDSDAGPDEDGEREGARSGRGPGFAATGRPGCRR